MYMSFLENFASSCIIMWVDRLSYIYVSMRAESVDGVTEDTFSFRRLGSCAHYDGGP